MSKLRITEIFYSLQGEARTVGWPTVFIRLTGCPLRCQYCDTSYAFQGGTLMSMEAILLQVNDYFARYVTVTGGEPLAQPGCLALLRELCDLGYEVSLETSGALDAATVDPRVIKVVDFKTPGSGEVKRNCYKNVDALLPQDQVKFVICNREDYDWAKDLIKHYQLLDRCEILFSASYNELDNQLLADWILQDKLPVRFQLQMHKYIWGEVAGR